jgi:hypothetical protein
MGAPKGEETYKSNHPRASNIIPGFQIPAAWLL